MTKKQGKPLTPEFTLPGEDSLGVQVEAYAIGLNVMARMLFDQLPPGATLPEAVIAHQPIEQKDIDEMAKGVSVTRLNNPSDKRPVTNAPKLFCEHYAKDFVAGYRFGLYAYSHGYLQVSYSLPDSIRRYELAFRFAWERIKQEPSPDIDALMVPALEEVKAIYKQYQALN